MTVAATAATVPSEQWRTGGRGGRQRLIPDPDTGELLPYKRVSTFAKTLDMCGVLPEWTAWMALKGAQLDRRLEQQALHAERTPKGIIERLKDLGGGAEKRDRGRDRHQILAMALTGAPMPGLPEQAQTELARIVALVRSLGEVVAVEAPVVCDRWRVAGTCDLVLKAHDGQTLVCDFKTGQERIIQAAIQLAAYARARYWDFATETRGDHVALDEPALVVIHAPQPNPGQEPAEPRAVRIDPQKATAVADLAALVRDTRAAEKQLVTAAAGG
jgi:hypothetical protein